MLLLRSFYRFILLGLALLGLSVSSVHAAIVSADDAVFGVDSVTIDDAGLEWLDLTKSTNRSYNTVLGQFGAGGEFEGWRYATTTEVRALYISAGAPASFVNGPQGTTNETWIAHLLDLWGITTNPGDPLATPPTPPGLFHPGSNAITGTGFNNKITAGLAIDAFPSTTIDFASTEVETVNRDLRRANLGSALVRADPLPAVPVPAAVWLFGTALIGLIGFGKRKARITA